MFNPDSLFVALFVIPTSTYRTKVMSKHIEFIVQLYVFWMDLVQLDTEPKSSPKVIAELYYFASSNRDLSQEKKKLNGKK